MAIIRSSFIIGEVIENHAWTERLFSLRIRAEQMPFKAGQFVRLQLPVDGDRLAKSYSLVNAPDEPDVEVFYNRVPGGRFSNSLASLQAGDSIEVSQPANGFFVLDEIPASRHLWMFATGTGLGPYISILKTSVVWERFEKIVLIHGAPLVQELAYADLIGSWQQNNPEQFRFAACVTREQNPAGLHGRVTELLAKGELEQRIGLGISHQHSHVMLCGNHNMIKDMRDVLAERGMSKHLRHQPGQITTEEYF
jgi:ferredoxin--NADP+ reductase